ncbi:MAG TPA: bifunctional glutamate N-acetyltransferase/amino-acid acetyltransferase ArgJ [Bryobacteraceae bacterium]|nr:bifunctional glutamate N-acetyltransferase/amino-acid acetyltransferase ArgJ [Bryobacteraceae bacterium]
MTRLRRTPEGIRLPRGFTFSAVAAGIKASRRSDLALIESSPSANAAALFTRNLVVAAPLEVGRESLASSAGRVRAVVVNSGNANCATGRAGRLACDRVCRHAAQLLSVPKDEIFPSSTGIIGVRLPAETIVAKLPDLIAARASTERAVLAFAQAIMTTDTRPKIAAQRFRVGAREVTIFGVAKGAGMIHPQLATMLVYLLTDAAATPRQLRQCLVDACDPTLNSMSVDGDTSTNDTVLLLANGQSGVRVSEASAGNKFSQALGIVCESLAEQIVSDGEGVRHVIRLFVEQARTREEALLVARTIAHSLLVKTAWAGSDPNWGRILAAIGRCGLPVDPSRVRIWIGNQMVCRGGVAHPFNERRAHQSLAQPECEIRVQLRRGQSAVRFLTTDLTAEYVRINADYST